MKNRTYLLTDCDRNGTERELIFHYDFDEYVRMGKVSLMFKGLFRHDVRRCISKEVMEEVLEALEEKHYEEKSNREFDAWCDKADDSKYNLI